MQAIVTKYLGPTNYRGSRIVATCDAGRLTLPYPHELGPGEAAHRPAAEALRDRLGWTGHLIGGYMADGRYAFVFGPADCPYCPTEHVQENHERRCRLCGALAIGHTGPNVSHEFTLRQYA